MDQLIINDWVQLEYISSWSWLIIHVHVTHANQYIDRVDK